MGFWSSVGSIVSGACGYVGSALSSARGYLGGALSTVVDMGKDILGSLGSFANKLLNRQEIFDKDERVEDIGDRAIQAHEQRIFPEQFENFDGYMDSLRKFELDPAKSKESTLDQKIYKGLEVGSRGLDSKFNAPTGAMANVWVLAGVAPDYFTVDRFRSILDSDLDIMSVADYFSGKLGMAESLEVEDKLVNIEQTSRPNEAETDIRKELEATRDAVQSTLG